VATFEGLLKDDPQYAHADDTLYQLAWALKLSGKGREAAQSFQQLATDHPDSSRAAEASFHVGEFTYEEKDYKAAATAYYTAMQKAGKSEMDEKASHKLAWSYYHQGKFDDAQKTYRYQLNRYPEGTLAGDAAFMEAECLFKQEQWKEALAAFERIGDQGNEEFEVLRLLHAAQAAAQLKQWAKSLELLGRFTERFPDSPQRAEAFYEQGWAQQNLDQEDEAIKLYEKAIGATDGETAARAQFMIGEIQFARKEHKAAVKSYFKVMYGYSYPTWQAEATFEAARCFEVLEKPDQAVELYRELVEKFPDSPRVPPAQKRLEELTAGAQPASEGG
jgi:TolA-binding protein